jgi:YidC/Oxa1 family membrane protein insertase
MTDIRRIVLWVVFAMSIILLWDAWQKHTGHGSLFTPAAPRPAAVGTEPSPSPSTVPAPSAATPASPAAVPAAPAAAAGGEIIDITTDLFKARLDTKGGSLVHVELLKYTDQNDSNRNVVLLDNSASRVYLAQTGLIAGQSAAALPNHLSAMTLAPGERSLQEGRNELVLRLESAESGGARLVKTYTFKRGEYAVGVKHEVVNNSGAPISPQLYLQLVRDGNPPPGESSFYFTFTGPAMFTEADKFQKVDFKDIAKGSASHARTANNGWVAMVQHYFASAWLVPPAQAREFRSAKVADNLYSIAMVLPLGEVGAGETKAHEATLFVGPQEENKLAALAPGLDLVKDYGWFTILSKPLFWLLSELHAVLGNWGWAIVALVVLLRIAFFWLNYKAYASMAKMKAINPKIMEMRERLKDKPQQMQQEMMRIYREEKVNPVGGCLPIFVQMPFFIALYWVLLSSVEMRGAPWIGWVTDLSLKDPFYILPLLMTGSTLLQTWLNPTPPDPVQARMMWIMPLVFSVMFFVFPAGLVLYWLTNNILAIVQQYVINRRLGVTK